MCVGVLVWVVYRFTSSSTTQLHTHILKALFHWLFFVSSSLPSDRGVEYQFFYYEKSTKTMKEVIMQWQVDAKIKTQLLNITQDCLHLVYTTYWCEAHVDE